MARDDKGWWSKVGLRDELNPTAQPVRNHGSKHHPPAWVFEFDVLVDAMVARGYLVRGRNEWEYAKLGPHMTFDRLRSLPSFQEAVRAMEAAYRLK